MLILIRKLKIFNFYLNQTYAYILKFFFLKKALFSFYIKALIMKHDYLNFR